VWGAIGKQTVGTGVVGFFQPSATCQSYKNATLALATPIEDINACLNTDLTELQTTNLKGEVQLFKGNKISLYNLFSKKVRNARNASDTTPLEARAASVIVVKVPGEPKPAVLEWVERLDWKAYTQALRIHMHEHTAQVERTVSAVSQSEELA